MTRHFYTQILILAALILGTNYISAKQIPFEQAEQYAKIAFAKKSTFKYKSAAQIQTSEHFTKVTVDEKPAYYIFNFDPVGFVVISAEDSYNPVLAFSDESHINLSNEQTSQNLFAALGDHERKIVYLREQGILAPGNVKKEWKFLKENTVESLATKDDPEGIVVAPLTTTTWNQGQYYNEFTPKDTSDPDAPDGGTYCGCAPVAMAQLIKYYDYPATGNGVNNYTDPQYGDISVDFCREYQWQNMPDSLNDYNSAVAEFIYHVGASTNTEYSTFYTSTYISYMRDALVEFWNYDESADWFYDSDGRFATTAVKDLNQGRPIILTGEAWSNNVFGGAHTWVVDGYGYFLDPQPSQPDEYFHCNWGWGGDNNGWFLDTGASWAPIPFSSGITAITYYYNRYVVHNIFPAEKNCGAPKTLYTSQISKNSVNLNTSYVTDYEQIVNFRIRKVGDTDWIEMNQTSSYVSGINTLDPDTEYEYQVRKQCCEGSWSDYTESKTFRTKEGVLSNACETFINSNLTTSSITDNNAYIYTSQPYGSIAPNQFRYRFVGSFIWTYSDINNNYYRYLPNLEEATEYEFQVRHQCGESSWSEFTNSQYFTTTGNVGCTDVLDLELFTSSVAEDKAYIYTSQPYGRVSNLFRYRATGTTDWATTSQTDSYYRYLRDLSPGTEYEFQVSHNCQGANWSEWSFSHTFTTKGGQNNNNCEAINGNRLYTSSVSGANAYVYTPQPFGNVANQFRYRPVGTVVWSNTTVSTLYYRYLRNLQEQTTYEFQVAQECAVNQWTQWSTSQTFTTLNGLIGGGDPSIVLPPLDNSTAEVSSDPMRLKAYPNPTSDRLTLELSHTPSTDISLSIFNKTGQRVEQTVISAGVKQVELRVEPLSAGLYLIQYHDGEKIRVEKFIKN